MTDRRYKQGLWLGRLIAVTPPLIFLVCAGVYLVSVKSQVLASLPQLVAAAAGLALDREIRIGGISYARSFNHVTLTDIAVSDAPTFAAGNGRAVLVADQVDIDLDARLLTHDTKNAAAFIQQITITRPRGYIVRLPGNTFNFSSFFARPPTPQAKPFSGRLIVRSGAVVFRDEMAPSQLQPAVNSLSGIDGVLDFGARRLVAFRVSANGPAQRARAVQAFGSIASVPTRVAGVDKVSGYDIHLSAQSADAPYWTRYFLESVTRSIGRVDTGRADLSLTLSQRYPAPGVPLDILGAANVTGATLVAGNRSIVRAPLENASAAIAFTGNTLTVHGQGAIGGMPVRIDGSIPSFQHAAIAMRFTAPQVYAARLHAALPFVPTPPAWLSANSPGSVVATATGPMARARFDVAFAVPAATVYGSSLTNIRGALRYEGKTLTVRQVVASAAGQRDNVTLNGEIGASPAVGTILSARAVGVDLGRLGLPPDVRARLGRVTGTADAQAVFVSGTPIHPGQRLPVVVEARMRNGSIHGQPIEDAAVEFTTDGRAATISRLVVSQPSGAVASVAGDLPLTADAGVPYHLRVNLAGLNLATTLPSFGIKGYTGLSYFRGSITGTASAPTLAGRASIYGAGYGKYAVDQVAANIAASPRSIRITEGVVRRLGISATFGADLTGLDTRSPSIVADASLRNTEIAAMTSAISDLLAASPKPGARALLPTAALTATGVLSASVHASGPLRQPAVTASAQIRQGSLGGFDIADLNARGSVSGPTVRVTRLEGTIDGARVDASGIYNTKTQSITGAASIAGADVARIARSAGAVLPVAGTGSATVAASGTANHPRVALSATLAHGAYNNVQVSLDKVELFYDGATVFNEGVPLVLTSGPATYTLNHLRYDVARKTILADGSIKGEQIARLVKVATDLSASGVGGAALSGALARVPAGLDGALSVPILDVEGSVKAPSVHGVAHVGQLVLSQKLASEPLSLDADVTYDQQRITVARLEGRGPVEYVSGAGSFVPGGQLSGRLEASNIPLALLQAFAPNTPTLGGDISDVSVVASGTAAQPTLVGSLSMRNVTVKGVTLDRIDSGRITVANNRIDLAGVTFIKTETAPGTPDIQHVATIRGFLPFVFSLRNGLQASFPSDAPVALTAQAPEQSVSLFSLFAPALRNDHLTGTFLASLNIGGTLRDKVITGSLQLKNGAVVPEGFRTAFRNINLNAQFNGAGGTITASRIESTSGGYLALSGAIRVAPEAAPARFASALDALLGNIQLDLTMRAAGFAINEPRIAALYNAGFQGVIDGDVHVTRGLLTPLLAGSLKVSNAVGVLPSVSPAQTAAPSTPAFDPSFHVAVVIAPGGRVRSQQIDAQADGKFVIAGNLSRPDVVGDLYLRNGRFRFPTATFRIVPTGAVHIVYNPPDVASERVDITATTSLVVSPSLLAANPGSVQGTEAYAYHPAAFTGSAGAPPQRYTVTVTISGDLSSTQGLSLEFRSNPPGLTSAQILASLGGQQALNALLVGGNAQQALQQEVQQIFFSSALPSVLEPLEYGIAKAFGVEEFSVDYSPQSPLMISVLKQVGPRLDVRYTRFVNSRAGGAVSSTLQPQQYSIAVDYNFTNRFRVNVSTDDQHNNTVGLDGVWNF